MAAKPSVAFTGEGPLHRSHPVTPFPSPFSLQNLWPHPWNWVWSAVSLCECRTVSFGILWHVAVNALYQVQSTLHLTVDPVNTGTLNSLDTDSKVKKM